MDSDTGPRDLDKLWKALPSFVRGLAQGEIGGRGKPTVRMPDPSIPSYACDVCGITFQSKDEPKPLFRFCRKCDGMLKDGYTAVVCDTGDFAIIKSEALKDMAGSMVKVSPPVMAMLKQKFDKGAKGDADGKDDKPN